MRSLGDFHLLLAPLCGFLYAFGGWYFKASRRIGIPLAICIVAYLYNKSKSNIKPLLIYLPLAFGAFCLPLTLRGDEIGSRPENWLWVACLGLLNALPFFMLVWLEGGSRDTIRGSDVYQKRVGVWLSCLYLMPLAFFCLTFCTQKLGLEHKLWEALIGGIYGYFASRIIYREQ